MRPSKAMSTYIYVVPDNEDGPEDIEERQGRALRIERPNKIARQLRKEQ